MRRFLVLYTDYRDINCYAEGLIHYDGLVYLRGFYQEEGKLFLGMYAVSNHLRDSEGIKSYHILMLDPEEKKG